jgi:tetratricopeptide (TPR) repeat protein
MRTHHLRGRPEAAESCAWRSPRVIRRSRCNRDEALRKEQDQRYSSVEQFSEDVGRYLAGRPVHARSGAWSYRAGKFIRRRRLAFSIAAAATVVIAGSAIAALVQEQRARNALTQSHLQLQTAVEMANSSLFEIHDAVAKLPGSTRTRALIVDRAIQSLARLQQNGGAGTQLRSGLAAAYEKLSDIQYRDGPGNLGASKAAEIIAKQALDLRQSLASADPGNTAALQSVAADLVRIGDIHRLVVKSAHAVREYRDAVQIYERLATADSASAGARAQLADARQNLAVSLASVEDKQGALEQIQLAVNLRRDILAGNPKDAAAQRGLEQAWLIRGNLERDQSGNYTSAVESQMQALAIARALAVRFPHQNSYRTDVASVLSSLGNTWMSAKEPAPCSAVLSRISEYRNGSGGR